MKQPINKSRVLSEKDCAEEARIRPGEAQEGGREIERKKKSKQKKKEKKKVDMAETFERTHRLET